MHPAPLGFSAWRISLLGLFSGAWITEPRYDRVYTELAKLSLVESRVSVLVDWSTHRIWLNVELSSHCRVELTLDSEPRCNNNVMTRDLNQDWYWLSCNFLTKKALQENCKVCKVVLDKFLTTLPIALVIGLYYTSIPKHLSDLIFLIVNYLSAFIVHFFVF